jgi:tetratricopeptide (TPR) repeat protein
MPTAMLNQLRNKLCGFALISITALIMMPVFLFGQSVDEQYLTGSSYIIKRDYNRAVESLTLAISRNNSDYGLYIKRGSALLKLSETESALADFNEANIILQHSADIWLARAYAQQGDLNNSILWLRNHLKSSFKLPEDSIKKDPSFDGIQSDPEWYALWQEEWYDDTEKVKADALFYMKRKQYEEAISRLDEEIPENEDNNALLLLRGKVFMEQGNYAAAIGDFSSVISADKTVPTVFLNRGHAYLKAGKYKEAINDLSKAVREDPANFDLYQERAEAYAGLLNYSSALKDMQFYLKYFNDDNEALYRCGEYYYAAEDYINALKCFNRNLMEDPNNPAYYKARGKSYLKTSTYRYAISDLSMSLDLNPGDAETWMYHGLAAIQSGDKENGCSSLNKARMLGSAEAVRYIMENCE